MFRDVRGLLIFLISGQGVPFLAALVTLLLVQIAAPHPRAVERIYSCGVYPAIATALSSVSRFVPFSLWDVFWSCAGVIFLAGILASIFRILRFGKFVLRAAQVAAVMLTAFYFLWGFNYFRPSLERRLPPVHEGAPGKQFLAVLDTLIARTNTLWIPIGDLDRGAVDDAVEASYHANAEFLGIPYPNGYRRPKSMLYSWLFAKAGVTGYFGPFFNEVQINSNLYPLEYPFVLAHEKAHQFGIASEAGANFCAFVVDSTSDQAQVRYSAFFSILQYFLFDARTRRDFDEYTRKIDAHVLADLKAERDYWQARESKSLSRMQTEANDLYLKSNRVEQGVADYDRVVLLVIQ
jgi:hypothetical protein